ncbi:bacterioferritin comigratory protein [Roseivivax marinus]|jgi:peroxiredoxin Q/BCP|uniref:thioredoxin-dependent peroxiredoxin n=1 Tax=Roseivivax marinus TaxID=1379903 RepID=W4HRH1_9RHOB|nr:peroxiredoxin [Roseivivax marinus]ETW14605.1 bacterioferritin comigratory protein [Roseivivax marinus]UMA66162.1 peroxiredoxin [Roseivivax marinus]
MIATGETAPDFTLPATGDTSVTLSENLPAVVFFYPRDDTSGCTKENEAFSALLSEFEAAGVKVFGISKDDIKSHEKFMAKKSLTVPLLSDAESDVCERYGVWAEKKMYGKTFMGIERSTVLVGKDGTIVQAWPKVKVPGHAEEVLEAARAL